MCRQVFWGIGLYFCSRSCTLFCRASFLNKRIFGKLGFGLAGLIGLEGLPKFRLGPWLLPEPTYWVEVFNQLSRESKVIR